MSRALPCGRFSLMSVSTTSAMSRRATSSAHVAPTFPAPTTVTFFLPLTSLPWSGGCVSAEPLDDGVGVLGRPHCGRVVARRLQVVGHALAVGDHAGDGFLQPARGVALTQVLEHQPAGED